MYKPLSLFLLLWTCSLSAKIHNTQYLLTQEIQEVRILVQKARVHLVPQKGSHILVQFKKPLDIKKETQQKLKSLLISEKDFPSPDNQGFETFGKLPLMTIKAPVKWPITLVLSEGQVVTKPMPKAGQFKHISIRIAGKGSLRTRNTKGTLSISQSSGDISVHSHKGDLRIQGEKVRASLQACSGEMFFVGFKGHLTVNDSRGKLEVRAFKLPLIIQKFKGELNFQQVKGDVHLKSMTGSVVGYSQEGEIKGLVYPKEVKIETKTGKINLDVPHSKAWVQADTWEGRLFTPSYFRRLRTGGMDRAQGRLKGRGKRGGNISLKSRSGSIRVHQSAP